ncbi:hypothetical protein [Streptomyces lunalinharesii]|uniref:Uncharacterized protein n=1 Tax=Streptomyces lunalinharesii TaxID=333384 RepID=A0ABN3RPD0_9ACTN
MSMTVSAADSLLSCTIEPDPDPLTVSTAKDPVMGRLDITVGLGNLGPAYCKSVTVRIPIGADASALTENRAHLTSAVSGATGWIARDGFADGTWQVFEFVPERPVQVTERTVTLIVSQIEVNTTVGEATIEIIEETSSTRESFTSKTTEAPVMKFPAEFVFRNFRPTKVMVNNGEHACLKWDGSADAAYTMYWGRNNCKDVSKVREWETPEPLSAPTGFMLQAAVTAGGQTLTHTLTTVVMVERPDLEVGNLIVYGDLKAESGTVRIRDLRGPSGVPLKINSNTEFLTGNNVTITDNLAIDGNLNANGDLNAKGNLNAVTDGKTVRIRDLRGPYGISLKINSNTEFLTGNNVTIGGNRALRNGDTLRFVSHKGRYLQEGADYGGEKEIAETSRTLYSNAKWVTNHVSSATSSHEAEDGREPLEPMEADPVDTGAEA